MILTGDAERRVVSPAELQTSIDACVTKYVAGRSFVRSVDAFFLRWLYMNAFVSFEMISHCDVVKIAVESRPLVCLFVYRPSGTEDVVRVYAEANTQVDHARHVLLFIVVMYEYLLRVVIHLCVVFCCLG